MPKPNLHVGCRTCRRRKIRCDERQPLCLRCEKSCIPCEGYGPKYQFIDEAAKLVKPVTTNEPGGKYSSTALRTASSRGTTCSKVSPPEFGRVGIPGSSEIGTYNWIPNFGRQLQPKADANIQVPFLLTQLFPGGSWLDELAIDHSSASAQPSIRALAAVYFGRRHQRPDSIREGAQLYIQALNRLNKDLSHPDEERTWSVSVLRSAATLELYEVDLVPRISFRYELIALGSSLYLTLQLGG